MSSQVQKSRIMIVDDNPGDTKLLFHILKGTYQVTVSQSGEQALENLNGNVHPDLILMDVNMPGMDGYETCKAIKASQAMADVDILFLSAHDSTEEILRGYEAGGLDYITKPYSLQVITRKIETALEVQRKRLRLSEQASQASKVAMMAMSDTGDLGNVVKFLRETFKVDSDEQLADLLIFAISEFNFSAVVYFECTSKKNVRSSEGDPTMLELELLERLAGSKTPFIERGNKLVAVQGNIAVLIKDADKGPTRMGSAKDYLMILLEGANAKLDYLAEKKRKAALREKNANAVILESEKALRDMQEVQKIHKAQSVKLLDAMVAEVEDSFVSMGLTEAQENQLLSILSDTSAKALEHFEEGLKVDEQVSEIIRSLASVARK